MIVSHNTTSTIRAVLLRYSRILKCADAFFAARGPSAAGPAPGAQRCAAGQAWSWDGVRFELLHPENAAATARKTNDLSCVLKVSAGARSMLLTGDIERPAEADLLQRVPGELRADVMLVPHHGSRTSTSDAFPPRAPFSGGGTGGYRNRFGHPNPDVLIRLSEQDFSTDRDGRGHVKLHVQDRPIGERQRRRRYWHDSSNTCVSSSG